MAVYVHRDPDQLLSRLAGERIHRAEALRICEVDRELLAAFVARLDRRMNFDLAISDRTLYLSLGEDTLTGAVNERRIVTCRSAAVAALATARRAGSSVVAEVNCERIMPWIWTTTVPPRLRVEPIRMMPPDPPA